MDRCIDGSQDVEPFLAAVETAAGVKRLNQRHLGKQVAVFPEAMRMLAVISCHWSLRAYSFALRGLSHSTMIEQQLLDKLLDLNRKDG